MSIIIRNNNRAIMVVDSEKEAKDRIANMPQYTNLSYGSWEPPREARHSSKRSRKKEEQEA